MKHRWIYAGICCMTIAALCAGIPSQSIRADACKGLTVTAGDDADADPAECGEHADPDTAAERIIPPVILTESGPCADSASPGENGAREENGTSAQPAPDAEEAESAEAEQEPEPPADGEKTGGPVSEEERTDPASSADLPGGETEAEDGTGERDGAPDTGPEETPPAGRQKEQTDGKKRKEASGVKTDEAARDERKEEETPGVNDNGAPPDAEKPGEEAAENRPEERTDEKKRQIKAGGKEEADDRKDAEEKKDVMDAIRDSLTAEDFRRTEGLDFSSRRILVMNPQEGSLPDGEHTLFTFEGLWLLQYESAEDARAACAYYMTRAGSAEPDSPVFAASGAAGTGGGAMTEEENPLAALEETLEDASGIRGSEMVALIDTGCSDLPGVTERLSFTGEDGSDRNGHGTAMAEAVLSVNSDASILSLQALDSQARGTVSSVYAAIRYAAERGVPIINLSLCALRTSEHSVIAEAVKDAAASGSLVVGAAGNQGRDVRYYTPGSISEALIAGAADERGARRPDSNFGSTVDYFVSAGSTSEAAAKLSGYLSAHGRRVSPKDLNGGLIFEPGYQPEEEDGEEEDGDEKYETSGEQMIFRAVSFLAQGVRPEKADFVIRRGRDESPEEFREKADFFRGVVRSSELHLYYPEAGEDSLFRGAEKAVFTIQDWGNAYHKIWVDANGRTAGGGTFWMKANGIEVNCTCVDPMIGNAPTGNVSTEEVTDLNQRKALFFSYGGPGWDTVELSVGGKKRTMKAYWKDVVKAAEPDGLDWGALSFNHYFLARAFDDSSRSDPWNNGISGSPFESFVKDAYKAVVSADTPAGLDNLEAFVYDDSSTHNQRYAYCRGAVIRVRKVAEKASDLARPGASLAGAVFAVKRGKKEEKSLVTGEDGYTDWYCVRAETSYIIAETKASPGFEINGEESEVSAENAGSATATVKEPGKETEITLSLVKSVTESMKHIAEGELYSLEGCTYRAYSDAACSKPVGSRLVSDAAGKISGSVTLSAGETCYLKETAAGRGFSLDEQVYTVRADGEGHVTVSPSGGNLKKTEQKKDGSAVIYLEDEPVRDGGKIRLYKRVGLPGGIRKKEAPVAGAVYEVKFYHSASASGTPTWTGTYTTDADGGITIEPRLLSGNQKVFPLGTLTVREKSAPAGYLVDENVYTGHVTQAGNRAAFSWTEASKKNLELTASGEYSAYLFDRPVFGGVSIRKKDLETGKNEPQGDADFGGITFLIKRAGSGVTYGADGTRYEKGDEVLSVTTQKEVRIGGADVYGYAASAPRALMCGRYTIEEKKTNGSYLLTDGSPIPFTVAKDGEIVEAEARSNGVRRGSAAVRKLDEDLGVETPQGDASPAGIRFELRNESARSIVCRGKTIGAGEAVGIFSTDEKGTWSLPDRALPYGHYRVKELPLKPGSVYANEAGMLYKENEQEFDVRKDGETVTLTFRDPVVRGGVRVEKQEKIWKKAGAQGDGSLSGIRFAVRNRSENQVVVGGKKYAPGEDVLIMVTDESGAVQTSPDALPYGTYSVRELPSEEDSALANASHLFLEGEKTFRIRGAGETVTADTDGNALVFLNDSVYGGFELYKTDLETMRSAPLGGASLAGISFTLKNASAHAVHVPRGEGGADYGAGDVIPAPDGSPVFVTDADGVIRAPADYLPFGTYTLEETGTNESYMHTDRAAHTFRIRREGETAGRLENGAVLTADDAESAALLAANRVIRSDFRFRKKDENGRAMAGIPFSVTNRKTGETHYILTDRNGAYSSASRGTDGSFSDWAPHTGDTNAHDAALRPYGPGGERAGEAVPEEVMASLGGRTGIWFGRAASRPDRGDSAGDGEEAAAQSGPDDGLGALPFGWYDIRELRCGANRGKTLITDAFMVDRDGAVLDLGTLDNEPVTITTTAADAESSSHTGRRREDAVIRDLVTYTGLDTGKRYVLLGELHYIAGTEDARTDGGPVMSGGEPVTGRVEFRPESRDGFREMELRFDASALTSGDVVVFETLYEETDSHKESGGPEKSGEEENNNDDDDNDDDDAGPVPGFRPAAQHADPASTPQAVHYPELETHLAPSHGESGEARASAKMVLQDLVTYRNLDPDRLWTVKGVLMDKETGKPARDGRGNEIRAEAEFRPSGRDGEITVTFEFDGTGLAGKSLVAFEKLYQGGLLFASHEVLGDADQTVKVTEPEATPTPDTTPTPEATPTPDTTPAPDVTPAPEVTPEPGSSTTPVPEKERGERNPARVRVKRAETEADGGTVKADPVKTGDTGLPFLWLSLLLISGAGLLFAIRLRRR